MDRARDRTRAQRPIPAGRHEQRIPFALDAHDRLLDVDLRADVAYRLGHRRGDCPHAPYGMTPCACDAIDLAQRMMQQQITRAARIGAREAADDRIEAERTLERIAR